MYTNLDENFYHQQYRDILLTYLNRAVEPSLKDFALTMLPYLTSLKPDIFCPDAIRGLLLNRILSRDKELVDLTVENSIILGEAFPALFGQEVLFDLLSHWLLAYSDESTIKKSFHTMLILSKSQIGFFNEMAIRDLLFLLVKSVDQGSKFIELMHCFMNFNIDCSAFIMRDESAKTWLQEGLCEEASVKFRVITFMTNLLEIPGNGEVFLSDSKIREALVNSLKSAETNLVYSAATLLHTLIEMYPEHIESLATQDVLEGILNALAFPVDRVKQPAKGLLSNFKGAGSKRVRGDFDPEMLTVAVSPESKRRLAATVFLMGNNDSNITNFISLT